MPEETILRKIQDDFELKGAEATAYMGDITRFCVKINPETVHAVSSLEVELQRVSVTHNETKPMTLSLMRHTPTEREKALLERI